MTKLKQQRLITEELKKCTIISEKVIPEKLSFFKNLIDNKFFPIKIIFNYKYQKDFVFFEFLLLSIFLIPVFIMVTLKHSENYKYAKLSNDKFRKKVRIEYEKLELYFNETIGKYDSNAKLNAVWEDAPFNTEFKNKPRKRTPVSILQLVK